MNPTVAKHLRRYSRASKAPRRLKAAWYRASGRTRARLRRDVEIALAKAGQKSSLWARRLTGQLKPATRFDADAALVEVERLAGEA